MKNFFNSVTGKLTFIAILGLLMLIPVGMIMGTIGERQNNYQNAVREVSSKWSHEQVVTGPILTIPYNHFWTDTQVGSNDQRVEITRQEKRYLQILPETLHYEGLIDPQVKKRGIYEVVLYELDLQTRGKFSLPDLPALNIDQSTLLWDQATLTVAAADTRGVKKQSPLQWQGRQLDFAPGLKQVDFLSSNQAKTLSKDEYHFQEQPFSGLQAKLPPLDPTANNYSFQYKLNLKGSQTLALWPTGKNTTANLSSNWTAPSFNGYFLPESSDNDDSFENGFQASWDMSYFGRKYGQFWISPKEDQSITNKIQDSAFGVELMIPVDFYQKNERAIKYAILFIGLTFLTFLGFEVLSSFIRVHPLQYILVGLAMAVFYLLLLSFSEQVGFTKAYIISSLATITLITLYSVFVLKAEKYGLMVGLVLIFVYGFLFTLLQLQDQALLVGSIALFVILAAIMWGTRNIDWYQVKLNQEG